MMGGKRGSVGSGLVMMDFLLTGRAPLLLHNGQMADPLNPDVQRMHSLAKEAKKSDAAIEALARMEYGLSLYLDAGRVVLPAENLLAMIRDGAQIKRLGKQVLCGVYVDGDARLEYDGPEDIDELYECGRFVDRSLVRIQKSRLMRVRPRFDAWRAGMRVGVYADIINPEQVAECVALAGERKGIGDRRPQFGRFAVEVVS